MSAPERRVPRLDEALQVLARHRGDAVVLSTMAAEREWIRLSQHERDFFYVPSSMGQAPTVGLGIALGRPDLRVVVLNGDGAMLMNLGCLVTIADQAPRNYRLVVVNNGVYEVTGRQRLPGAGRISFETIARGAGFQRVYTFRDLESWQEGIREFLEGDGPTFGDLHVLPTPGDDLQPVPPCPMPEQIVRFQRALGIISQ